MKLKLATTLSLPIDAVTQKIAWLGRTGSGKTFGCKRLVEQMLHAGAQVVILDGSGAWAGLRLGKKPFKIPVFGGLYGDIPLESTGGTLVADVIVDRRTSMVLDVSQMLDAERTRFATAFAERFFFRKKSSPSAVHLVLEECQDFVPENQQRGEERMLHEFQRLAKQGRAHGIGMSFLSQRPQEISKKALNQVECVFAFQMTGPHERKALQYWLSDKGFEEKLSDVLPRLEVGAPHVWSPQWLKVSNVVRILPIESLDTSRTPKVGEKKFKQKTLKPIDLKALKVSMAETIERSKAEDPKELRKRITELEKELKKKTPAAAVVTKGVVLKPYEMISDRRHIETIVESAEYLEEGLKVFMKALEDVRRRTNGTIAHVRRARATGPAALAKRLEKAPLVPVVSSKTKPNAALDTAKKLFPSLGKAASVFENKVSNGAGASIGGGLRRMMIALAQRPGLTNRQLGVRAGLSSRSGTFSTYLSRGRTEGWVSYDGDRRSLTDAGLQVLGHYDPLPEGRDLLNYWLDELGGGASRMLSVLSAHYPDSLTNEQLGEAAGISHRSGTFSTYLSRLRTLELVEGRGELKLSEELVGS